MRYTASSVKRELQTNADLEVRGGLGCPQDSNWTQNGNTPCLGAPATCLHTQDQTCKQSIEICYRETGCKLSILTFYFTIWGMRSSPLTQTQKMVKYL